jgi:hypothetical protein
MIVNIAKSILVFVILMFIWEILRNQKLIQANRFIITFGTIVLSLLICNLNL